MNSSEQIQYNAALAITGTKKRNNLDKIYEELGWESLTNRPFYLCKPYIARCLRM